MSARTLGRFLHSARTRRGLTRDDVATATAAFDRYVSHRSLQRIEHDEIDPTFGQVSAIVRALEIPLEDLAQFLSFRGDHDE